MARLSPVSAWRRRELVRPFAALHPGGEPLSLSSRAWGSGFVEVAVAEHGEEHADGWRPKLRKVGV
jgi:hypothetical protein